MNTFVIYERGWGPNKEVLYTFKYSARFSSLIVNIFAVFYFGEYVELVVIIFKISSFKIMSAFS
jgi:hypothetical protein